MISTFAAAPGTLIVERVRGDSIATLTPVLGFVHVQGGVVFPLTVMGGKQTLTRGRALLTPDGYVSDASYGFVFASMEEWMRITDTDAYWIAPTPVNAARAESAEDFSGDDSAALEAGLEKARTAGEATRKTPIPDKPKGKPQLFQTTSFWMKRAAGQQSARLFKVEGGVPAPAKNDDAFEKIKRDEWLERKKQGVAVMDWPEKAASEAPAGEDIDEDDLV